MRKRTWIVLLIAVIVVLAAIGIVWRINAQKKADTAGKERQDVSEGS